MDEEGNLRREEGKSGGARSRGRKREEGKPSGRRRRPKKNEQCTSPNTVLALLGNPMRPNGWWQWIAILMLVITGNVEFDTRD